jgi:hypothetical protein
MIIEGSFLVLKDGYYVSAESLTIAFRTYKGKSRRHVMRLKQKHRDYGEQEIQIVEIRENTVYLRASSGTITYELDQFSYEIDSLLPPPPSTTREGCSGGCGKGSWKPKKE